jgi:glutamate-ammonia-ligase adenylyltransferase
VDDDFGQEIMARWPTYPALRSDRAVEIFNRLRPELLSRLKEAAKPEEALLQFDGFLKGLPAGVQLFSLFEANPQLTQLIVDIAATAPALAQHLSRHSGVFDAVIGGDFFSDWPGRKGLERALSETLAEMDDYEAQLDTARRWAKEWHFRIGVHHLRALITPDQAGQQYADLAGAVISALWPIVAAQFASKHGDAPGRGAVVLGMGSLGSERLNAASDLDLIVIYDAAGVDMSDGRRPLATRAYYARLTQALVTALSAPMAQGRLYEVDMRLRPSGRQGPVATQMSAFQSYQLDEAWTWEHLAMTRARPIAGNMDLGAEVEAFRHDLLAQVGRRDQVPGDVADMRARIADAKAPQGLFDAKIGPGRLQDIELLAQTAALRAGSPARDLGGQLSAGVANGWISAGDAASLSDAAGLYWSLQAAARLLTTEALDPAHIGLGGTRLILRETGAETLDDLSARLAETWTNTDQLVTRMLGRGGQKAD